MKVKVTSQDNAFAELANADTGEIITNATEMDIHLEAGRLPKATLKLLFPVLDLIVDAAVDHGETARGPGGETWVSGKALAAMIRRNGYMISGEEWRCTFSEELLRQWENVAHGE